MTGGRVVNRCASNAEAPHRQKWAASVVCGWSVYAVSTIVRDELITGVERAADKELIRNAPTVGLQKLALLAAVVTLGCALGSYDAVAQADSVIGAARPADCGHQEDRCYCSGKGRPHLSILAGMPAGCSTSADMGVLYGQSSTRCSYSTSATLS